MARVDVEPMKFPFIALLLGACASPLERREEACGYPADPAAAPLSLFAYDASTPLNVALTQASENDAAVIQSIAFDGAPGSRVTGHLVMPREPVRGGVIALHGMPGSSHVMLSDAGRLAANGIAVLSVNAPFARREGSPLRFTSADSVEQVQLMIDLRRAVDVLIEHAGVDAGRIGYMGYSYGAAMGALFAGIEPRLGAAVLAVGDGGLVAHFAGPDDPECGPPWLAREQWLAWRAAMLPIEPIRFVGGAAPTALYFQGAMHDELVPPVDHEDVVHAASEPKRTDWYATGHGLNAAATADRIAWLTTMLTEAATH